MEEVKKLDDNFLESIKIKYNLMDFVNAVYKPVLHIYIKDDKKSEEENIVAEEYRRLVFYIQKIKRIFHTLKHALNQMSINDNISNNNRNNLIRKIADVNECVSEAFKNLFGFKQFKLFLTLSTIPDNTEFHYLGVVDSIELEQWSEEFDPIFKRYIEVSLKNSCVVPK